MDRCPLHPGGGCKFAGHGTYSRKFPDGAKIARWYCPDGRTTFGLLPDCLSSRLPGTLIEVETVINQIESAPSQEAAADNIRPDIGLPGILRWMRHRLFLIRASLILLIDRLLPNQIVQNFLVVGICKSPEIFSIFSPHQHLNVISAEEFGIVTESHIENRVCRKN
ncbi:MAG: hypothetical protein ABIJ59_09845 [Pseudomonadota bacterium]